MKVVRTAESGRGIGIYNPVPYALSNMPLDPSLQVARMLLDVKRLDFAIVGSDTVMADFSLVKGAEIWTMWTAEASSGR